VDIIISTPSSEKMAKALSTELCLPHFPIAIRQFPGGEFDLCVELPELRGKRAILVHSLAGALHDQWMTLFFLSRRIKQMGSVTLTVLLPYMAYARQDKSKDGTTPFELIPHMIHTCGIDHVFTLDLHVPHLKKLFSIAVEDIEPHLLFAPIWGRKKRYIVVSPDQGGHQRAQKLAQTIKAPWIYLTKHRDTGKEPSVSGGDRQLFYERECIVVDDILDTGGTLCAAVAHLKQQGAVRVTACITHFLCSSPCLDRLHMAGLDHLYTSDTLPILEAPSWVSIMSTVPLLSEKMKTLREE
jgi:ribose-phosphate pyrophosphokinase